MTLSGYTVRPVAPPETHGLATTALVLGLIGLPALVACGIGLPLALTGLVIGTVALRRSRKRSRARRIALAGVVACVTTIAVGAALITWLLVHAAACGDPARYPDEPARKRCIEREFPFAEGVSQQ